MRLAFLIICFGFLFLQSFGVPLSNGRSSDVSSNRRYVKPIRVDLFGSEEAQRLSLGDEHLTRSNTQNSINLSNTIQSTDGDLCTKATQRAKYLNRLKMFNDFVKTTIQFLGEASSVVEENLDFEAGQLDNYLELENIDCPKTKNITKELMYGDDEVVEYQGNSGDSEKTNEITCSLNFNKTLSFNINSGETGPLNMKIDLELKTLPFVQTEDSNDLSVNHKSEGSHNLIEANEYNDRIPLNKTKVLSRKSLMDSESAMETQNIVHDNAIIPIGSEIQPYEDEAYLRSFSGKMASSITEMSQSTNKDTTESNSITLEDEITEIVHNYTENPHITSITETSQSKSNDTFTTSITYTLEDEITRTVSSDTQNPQTKIQGTSNVIVTTPFTYTTDEIWTKTSTEDTPFMEIKEENVVHDAENNNIHRVILMPTDNPKMEARKCKSTIPHVEDDWCITNCARGFCPPGYCNCA